VEVVVSFLAILELLKAGECDARQDASWGDIEVVALKIAV
jgi:chromatin segregation and condensation protein Rec8/ScpA/Scc1 (kleisin family)